MNPTAPILAFAFTLGLCACSSARPASWREPIAEPDVIRGLVSDRRGDPSAAKVWVVMVREGASGSRSAGIGADGLFEFASLDDGPYVVTATTADGRIAFEPEVPAGTFLKLPPLTRGATITVELRGRPTSRLAVIKDEVRVLDFTIREGAPVDVVVPVGDVELLAYERGQEQQRQVRLEAGDRDRVVFDKHP